MQDCYLSELNIPNFDNESYNRLLKSWDSIAKPLNGLGDFERITSRIGAILGDDTIDISKRALVIMCADNGIIYAGVSQSGSDVTASVAALMGEKKSSVCLMAEVARVDTYPVDIGIKDVEELSGVANHKINKGTRHFLDEPAMTEEEVLQAIKTGIEMVEMLKAQGYRMIATGEMGIGNTTTSATVLAGLLNLTAEQVAGRGAGLSDSGLTRKIKVINRAIAKYNLHNTDALEVLRCVGGLDIAGLCGVFIGGALHKIPIVIDGLISAVAALTAEKICPGVKDYCIASHRGGEQGVSIALKELSLEPVIEGKLALGEGTGAVMIFPLLDMVLSIYKNGVRFSDTDIDQYVRMT